MTNAEADRIFQNAHTSREAHVKALELANLMWRSAATPKVVGVHGGREFAVEGKATFSNPLPARKF